MVFIKSSFEFNDAKNIFSSKKNITINFIKHIIAPNIYIILNFEISSPIKVFKQSIVKLKIPINAKFILNISGPEWIPKIRVNSEYNKTWIDAKTKSPKSEIK